MTSSSVSYSRGQVQIQQMAFVLVAFIILAGMGLVVYVTISYNSSRGDALALREERSKQLALTLASLPELSWGAPRCAHCIDLDKAMVLSEQMNRYESLFPVAYLALERVYPIQTNPTCSRATYPACSRLVLMNRSLEGITQRAFVNLCYYVPDLGGYTRCDLGRVLVIPRSLS